ncbi:hypothetical protein N7513_000195 [Penicillium frequentans]|nr:hypothetical protein N7513_000195 [Penicillium glabrum]
MADPRTSQRIPQRCTECARRRVRCNKKVPCGECITKNRAHLCTREVVRVRGKLTVATPVEANNGDIIQENSKLRERVAELELALVMSLQDRAGLQARPTSGMPSATFNSENITAFEEVGAILDDWNLGIVQRSRRSDDSLTTGASQPLDTLRSLPNRVDSNVILQFSLKMLGWIHCAVRADQFITDHDILQDAMAEGDLQGLHDHGWMAIYFSLLTVGLFFMDDEEFASLGFHDAQDQPLDHLHICHTWYDSAIRQLELSNAMARPQLSLVQVAAILTLCNSHFGENFRESNLTSQAINTARELNMHRLGTEASFPSRLRRMPEWDSRAKRELGRRLWWTLVICDWLAALRGMNPNIPSDSFDCTVTIGQFDNNVILNGISSSDGDSMFSPLLHHIELAKVSQQVYEYLQIRKKSPTVLCEFLKNLSKLESDFVRKFESVSNSFAAGSNNSIREPLWVSGQRSHYLCTLNYLRLSLSRILLQPSISDLPVWSEIRSQAINAALNTVQMSEVPHVYRLMWIFGSATIAAGVFLCLDILVSDQRRDPALVQERRQAVELCIATLLPYAHKTTICKEGPRALRWLLELEAAQHDGHVRRQDIMQTIISSAQASEGHVVETTMNHHQSLFWPVLGNGDNYHPHGQNLLSPGMSEMLPGALQGYEQSDFDWIMDTIMFPTGPE